jgi:hypothetical protein
MTPVIDAVLEIAYRVARQRSSSDDLGHEIIAGPRRLYGAAIEADADEAALGLRTIIRETLLARNLETLRATRRIPGPAALPSSGASAKFATAVFEDAAGSSVAFNAVLSGNVAIAPAAQLVDRLVEQLGGSPDYAALIARIGRAGSAAAHAEPWSAQAPIN